MNIELFRAYCDCVIGCIIAIIVFSAVMYMLCYVIRKFLLDDCFKGDKK